MLITGGRLVDMVTGQIRAADIGVVGGLIASVHAPGSRSDAARTIDADRPLRRPRPDRHAYAYRKLDGDAAALCRGGGAAGRDDHVVWDPHEFGNVAGLEGMHWAIEAARPAAEDHHLGAVLRALGPGLELGGAPISMRHHGRDAVLAGNRRRRRSHEHARRYRRRADAYDDRQCRPADKMVAAMPAGWKARICNAFMAAGIHPTMS
jgi:hypothetical protein